MAEVSFRVNDVGVASFIEKIKQKSSEMTSEMIRDAQRQTTVAKEQLKLVEDRIRAIEKYSKLDSQVAEQSIRQTAQQRIITSQARIASLAVESKRKYNSGEITADEYQERKKRIGRLSERFSEEGINAESEEQIAQLKEQARQSSILASYMRENIAAVNSSSRQQVTAIRQGDNDLVDAIDENQDPQLRLANQLASQQVQNDKKKEEPDWRDKMLTLANAITLEKVGGMVSNIPNTKNELEYIEPMMSVLGMTIGGIAGNLIDAANVKVLGSGLGNTSFGQLGAQLGEKIGEFAGASLERTYRSRDELTTSNFKLKALAGRNIGSVEAFGKENPETGSKLGGRGVIDGLNQNLERYALSMREVSQLQYDVAMRVGSSRGLGRNTESMVAMEHGWGVRQETSMALFELLRSSKDGDKNIANIVGGVLQKGSGTIFKDGDRAFLNEFLTRNYTQLQKTLLASQTSVHSGTTMDILNKFNSMGGEFSAKDSRSTGYINTIQQSLSNPGSDSMKALSYYVMRKSHPNMNLADTGIEIQKGMGSSTYLQSMMQYLTSQGGDESYQTYNIASAFGLQNNLAVAKRLLKNYKSGTLGKGFSMDNLKGTGEFSEGAAQSLGEQQTSTYARSTAEIENAFLEGAVQGIGKVKDKMVGLFGDMIDELKIYISDEIQGKTSNKAPEKNKLKYGGGGFRGGSTGAGGPW